MENAEDLFQEIQQVEKNAELLHSAAEVEQAIINMAHDINSELHNENPVIISIMLGAIVVTGKLLPYLEFPLQLEYFHATRYRDKTRGGKIIWRQEPELDLTGRTILIVDDILDEGETLAAIKKKCLQAKANKVYVAVLVDKMIDRPRALDRADFTGLTVPDRYVFGYGMDYKGFLRNVNGIYAVKES